MKPNLLIAGGARCGTAFLHQSLMDHPGVSGATGRRPSHFLAYGAGREFHGPGDALSINRDMLRSVDQWREMFSTVSNTYVLESSVSTLYGGVDAVDRILGHCAVGVKIIVVLRDPVQRMVSAHQHLLRQGCETLSLDHAVAAEPARIRDHWQHGWHYTAMGRYGELLAPFVATFGRDLFILDHEDLVARPRETLGAVFEWLNLGEACSLPSLPRRDELELDGWGRSGCAPANPWLEKLMGMAPVGLRQWVEQRRVTQASPEDVRARFRNCFQEDIHRLKGLLPRESWPTWLAAW